MGTLVALQKWSIALLLVCCLSKVAAALDGANSTEYKVEDYRHRQRIVGGEAERNENVVRWQVLFLKNGSFSASRLTLSRVVSCNRSVALLLPKHTF